MTPPTIGDRLREIENNLIIVEALAERADESLHRAERRRVQIGRHATAAFDELYWASTQARVMATPAPNDDQAADLVARHSRRQRMKKTSTATTRRDAVAAYDSLTLSAPRRRQVVGR